MSMVGNIALKITSDRGDLPVFAGASGRLQIRMRGSLPGLDDGLVNGRCSGHELSLGALSADNLFPSMAHSGTALAAPLSEQTHHSYSAVLIFCCQQPDETLLPKADTPRNNHHPSDGPSPQNLAPEEYASRQARYPSYRGGRLSPDPTRHDVDFRAPCADAPRPPGG